MSGLETLPPDQRAVLQLILRQGRGYAELAELLKIEPGAVRTRAHAGLEALAGGGAGLSPDDRARVADYLLGEQDEGERIVTLAALGESPAASRWAQALRAKLAPLAREPLPELPAPAAANGSAPTEPALPRAEPAAVVARPAASAPARAPVRTAAAPPRPFEPAQQASRLGGALLLAGIAAVAAIIAVILISSGGGGDSPSAATATTHARSTPARTQPARTTGTQTGGRVVAQVNLLPTASGGRAVAVGLVQQQGTRRTIALRAQALPANGSQDIYGAWLQGSAGTKFLGFVPQQVKEGGTFTVSATLPPNAGDYDEVLVTRESITATPAQPGEAILRGTLSLS